MKWELPEEFEAWVENDLKYAHSGGARIELHTRTGLQDHALITLTTGIIGFDEENGCNPIQQTGLIHPRLRDLFVKNEAFRTYIQDAIVEQFAMIGYFNEDIGLKCAKQATDLLLHQSQNNSWTQHVTNSSNDTPSLPS